MIIWKFFRDKYYTNLGTSEPRNLWRQGPCDLVNYWFYLRLLFKVKNQQDKQTFMVSLGQIYGSNFNQRFGLKSVPKF
jgi:hypothetical protein